MSDNEVERGALHRRESDLQDFPPPAPDYDYHMERHGSCHHDEHKRSHSLSIEWLDSKAGDDDEVTNLRPSNCIREGGFLKNKQDLPPAPPKKSSAVKGPREGMRHLTKTKDKMTGLERMSENLSRASENLMRASEKWYR